MALIELASLKGAMDLTTTNYCRHHDIISPTAFQNPRLKYVLLPVTVSLAVQLLIGEALQLHRFPFQAVEELLIPWQ